MTLAYYQIHVHLSYDEASRYPIQDKPPQGTGFNRLQDDNKNIHLSGPTNDKHGIPPPPYYIDRYIPEEPLSSKPNGNLPTYPGHLPGTRSTHNTYHIGESPAILEIDRSEHRDLEYKGLFVSIFDSAQSFADLLY